MGDQRKVPFKVEELLSAAELEEFETFAREPGRSVDELHQWVLERGFTISRSSVGRWFADFRERGLHERVRQAVESSARYVAVAKEAGVEGMASASLARFQQLLFETLVKSDEADAGTLMKLSIAMETAVKSGRHIEKLKEEIEKRQARAIEKAERDVKAGASAGDVVATIKRALGISA